MAEPAPGKAKATRSFSEIEELPPLNEAYVPEAASAGATANPTHELRQTQFPARGETPKPPAEVTKKAVEEIRKTPPKLFIYSIGAAVFIMLLVIGLIAWRIHGENAGEDGRVAPLPSSSGQGAEAAQTAPAQSDSRQRQVAAPPEASGSKQTVITIKPKYVARKPIKPAPPVAVLVPGQLTVNTVPAGAQITVDGHGEPDWLTPFDIAGLAPGHHTVTLSKAGFGAETRSVEVASRSKASLLVQLAQLPAMVLVAAEPAGAQILIDGRDTGRVTPSQISVDKPGSHSILLKKQGYLEESTTVNLTPGQSFRYAPSLRQLGSTDEIKTTGKLKKLFGGTPDGMGAVSVKTQPKGAQIAVNRRILDKNSPAEFYLNPGTYVIDITMTGYKGVQRVVNLEKDGKLAIDEILERQ
jgi:hypothetical protein